jgi:hypothetical protein
VLARKIHGKLATLLLKLRHRACRLAASADTGLISRARGSLTGRVMMPKKIAARLSHSGPPHLLDLAPRSLNHEPQVKCLHSRGAKNLTLV